MSIGTEHIIVQSRLQMNETQIPGSILLILDDWQSKARSPYIRFVIEILYMASEKVLGSRSRMFRPALTLGVVSTSELIIRLYGCIDMDVIVRRRAVQCSTTSSSRTTGGFGDWRDSEVILVLELAIYHGTLFFMCHYTRKILREWDERWSLDRSRRERAGG